MYRQTLCQLPDFDMAAICARLSAFSTEGKAVMPPRTRRANCITEDDLKAFLTKNQVAISLDPDFDLTLQTVLKFYGENSQGLFITFEELSLMLLPCANNKLLKQVGGGRISNFDTCRNSTPGQ